MNKLLISLIGVLLSLQLYSQKELKGFYDLDIQVISDSIFYDSFWENNIRKVKIQATKNNDIIIDLEMNSYPDDSTFILGKIVIINYKKNIRKNYIWAPNYGKYYIGKISILNNRMTIDKSYANYDDESVNGFNDYTTIPETDIKYKKGTYFLDLSIVKTFPAYFKKLYEEKHLKDNSQKQYP